MKKILVFLSIFLLSLSTHAYSGNIYLNINGNHFDPLTISQEMLPEEGENYYIIQYNGPIQSKWKEATQKLGTIFFDYIPDFAFIIKTEYSNIEAIKSLSCVRWIGDFPKKYKIASNLRSNESSGLVELKLSFFPGCDITTYTKKITEGGGTIINSSSNQWASTFTIKIPSNQISMLINFKDLKWIAPRAKATINNNIATDITNIRPVRNTYGIYGEGQVVGVCDSGLDQGSTDPSMLLLDFQNGAGKSRIKTIFDVSGDGTADLYSGHGTHVTGSILGNGVLSGSTPLENDFPETCFAGMAPKAQAILQAADKVYIDEDGNQDTYIETGSDLNDLFGQSQDAGSHLHSNSWGSSEASSYSTESQQVDQYSWKHKNFLILFAAGNSGIDLDNDGIIDKYSIGAPGTAKNCLTVGASESLRESYAYGAAWPTDYPANPISSDFMADNTSGMAAFSSRGPTRDGRTKPDIVAPGTRILSTRSSVAANTYGIYSANTNYAWMSGTSMSTPITAGSTALLREYLIKEKQRTSPSAALLKAALVNSAYDMTPGQYGEGEGQEIPDGHTPDNVQGWGRLDLGRALYPQSPFTINYYDQETGLNTGEEESFTLTVQDSTEPLRINLAWTDYPGSPATQGALVNDLDLSITDPTGLVHYPDNKQGKSHVFYKYYDEEGDLSGDAIFNAVAVHFTPEIKPFTVESIGVYLNQPGEYSANITIKLYEKEITDENLLYTKSIVYRDNEDLRDLGYITFDIDYEQTINNDIYVVIEDDSEYIAVHSCTGGTGHSLIKAGEVEGKDVWGEATVEFIINMTANVTSDEQNYDHTNNLLGITIDNPVQGDYQVKVSGYNIPIGPQPYALVVSGEIDQQQSGSINCIKNCQMTGQSENSQDAKDVMAQYGIDVTTNNSQLQIRSFNATVVDGEFAEFAFNKDDFTIKNIQEILLYKLINDGHKQFTYSTAGNSDGTWWLEDSNNNKMSGNSQIDTSQTYEVHFVIQDNGSFDTDKTTGKITDPQTIIEVDTEESSSSSSSGGCLFNPEASFGMEWLFLLAIIMILRMRSKA